MTGKQSRLNTIGYILIGTLKNNIYFNRPANIDISRRKITEEILLLNTKNNIFITNCMQIWKENIQTCYNVGGGYTET